MTSADSSSKIPDTGWAAPIMGAFGLRFTLATAMLCGGLACGADNVDTTVVLSSSPAVISDAGAACPDDGDPCTIAQCTDASIVQHAETPWAGCRDALASISAHPCSDVEIPEASRPLVDKCIEQFTAALTSGPPPEDLDSLWEQASECIYSIVGCSQLPTHLGELSSAQSSSLICERDNFNRCLKGAAVPVVAGILRCLQVALPPLTQAIVTGCAVGGLGVYAVGAVACVITTTCTDRQVCCDEACIRRNTANCATCGNVCGPCEVCAVDGDASQCQSTCDTQAECCNNRCVDDCPAGERLSADSCECICEVGLTRCGNGGACADCNQSCNLDDENDVCTCEQLRRHGIEAMHAYEWQFNCLFDYSQSCKHCEKCPRGSASCGGSCGPICPDGSRPTLPHCDCVDTSACPPNPQASREFEMTRNCVFDPQSCECEPCADGTMSCNGTCASTTCPDGSLRSVRTCACVTVTSTRTYYCDDGSASPEPCPAPSNAAQALGDPHLRTFDGVAYDMQALGELTLIADSTDALEVQIRTQRWFANTSVVVAAAARVGGDRVVTYVDGSTTINGAGVELAENQAVELPTGGVLLSDGRKLNVIWADNAQLHVTRYPGYLGVEMFLAESRRSRGVAGLLGDFDGLPDADLRIREGGAMELPPPFEVFYGEFVESWRVSAESSLFDYAAGESTETFTDRSFPPGVSTTAALTVEQRDAADAACRAAGVPDGWLDACVLDVGVADDALLAEGLVTSQSELPALEVVPGPSPLPSSDLLGEVLFFNGGLPFPAGTYEIAYTDGCMKYAAGQLWTVHANNALGWWLVGSDSADRKGRLPGTTGFTAGTGFERFEDCVAANHQTAPFAVEHAGGVLGIWLSDSLYTDNVNGTDGRNPRWSIRALR